MLKINSKIEKNLLSYFFLNTEKSHHLQELSRILKADPSNLNKKIKELKKADVFKVEERGNQKIYSLNKDFCLYEEYKGIINKTYGIENILKNTLNKIPKIKEAYIFGSYTKDSFDNYSDIDLLIIGNHDGLELSNKISNIEEKIKREINPVEYSPNEYKKLKTTDPFLKMATKKLIKLI